MLGIGTQKNSHKLKSESNEASPPFEWAQEVPTKLSWVVTVGAHLSCPLITSTTMETMVMTTGNESRSLCKRCIVSLH